MSQQGWCVIVAVHVFLIILQEISPIFVETIWWSGKRKKQCPQRKNIYSKQVINGQPKEKLQEFLLDCTATIVYEVRYIEKGLKKKICGCGETQKGTIKCKENKDSNISIVISIKKLSNQWGENCTFTFKFKKNGRIFSAVPHAMTIKETKKKILISSNDVTGVSTSHFFTPNNTTVYTNPESRIGQQVTATSSYISSQTEFAHLTTLMAEQISSTTVKPQPSQIFTSVYIGVVISPSIYQSKGLQRSVPATPSLATKPVLMTSLKGTIASDSWTFIQASVTTFEVLPSNTLSSDKEKMKLKQDIEFINNVNISSLKIGDENTINHILDAAANLIKTNLTTDDQTEDPGMQAVEVLENLGNSISQQLHLGNNTSVTFEKVTEDLIFGAAVINTTTSPGYTFPSDDIKMTGGEKINIPNSVFVSGKY